MIIVEEGEIGWMEFEEETAKCQMHVVLGMEDLINLVKAKPLRDRENLKQRLYENIFQRGVYTFDKVSEEDLHP